MIRHPRLLLGKGGLESVRRRARAPQMARFRRYLDAYCARAMREEPVLPPAIPSNRDSRAGGELRLARKAQQRTLSLAFSYLLTGRTDHAWRAWREMDCLLREWKSWEDPFHAAGGFGYDLMVGELGLMFGLAYDWLYEALSPVQRSRIRSAVRERVLDLYLKETGHGPRQVWWFARNINNWNAICNSGAVFAALALRDDYPGWREVLRRAVSSMRRYFRTFGDEGGSEEGVGYWRYGMSYAVLGLAALDGEGTPTGGLMRLPALRNTGRFPIDFQPGGVSVGWGDHFGNAQDPLQYWLGARFREPAFMEWQDRQPLQDGFDAVLSILWRPVRFRPSRARRERQSVRGRFYRKIGWAVFADSWSKPSLVAGFKCATLNAAHGHLDNGSFSLWTRGRQIGHDLGPPVTKYYAHRYFSESRWEWYNVKTSGHSALTIGGREQVYEGKGSLEPLPPSRGWAGAVADASGSYGTGVKLARRHFVISDDGKVAVTLDEVSTVRPGTVEWRLHSPERIAVRGDRARLGGSGAEAVFPSGLARLRAVDDPPGFRSGYNSRYPHDRVLEAVSRVRARRHIFPAAIVIGGRGSAEADFRVFPGRLELEVRRGVLRRLFSWSRRRGRWFFGGVR